MDERPREDQAPLAPAAPETPQPAPKRPAPRWRGVAGTALALVIAFAWGALAYREMSPVRKIAGAPVAVAGMQAAPGWMTEFANAFCSADGKVVSARLGGQFDGKLDQVEHALATRDWDCTSTRFLGSGTNVEGQFFVYVTVSPEGKDQWWVFTVVDDRVVAID